MPNQARFLIFYSTVSSSHKKLRFSKISDDAIACDLRFALPPPPIQNPGYTFAWNHVHMYTRYQSMHLCIVFVTRTFTSGCLYHCKGAKYTVRCIASSLKVLWYESMKWNMEENFSMEWNMEQKIFNMEWKWNGRKLPEWYLKNHLASHSIPYHALTARRGALRGRAIGGGALSVFKVLHFFFKNILILNLFW